MTTTNAVRRPADTTGRQAAWTAAISLLLSAVLAPWSYLYVLPRVLFRDDVGEAVRNVGAHPGLLLAAILGLVLTFVADVLIAWALYVLLAPVNRSLSMLTAWFRLVYTALAAVALGPLVTVLRLVRASGALDAVEAAPPNAEVRLLIHAFRAGWSVGFYFFVVHLLLLGWLVFRSGRVPRTIGVLLALNGLGYLVDTLRPYAFPGVSLPFLPVLFFGELVFMVWLFWKAPRWDAEER